MESVEHGVISAFAWITDDKYDYLKSNLDKNFEELNIDSLDITEVCMEIEEKFDLEEIQDNNIENFKTIKDVIDFVETQRNRDYFLWFYIWADSLLVKRYSFTQRIKIGSNP